MTTTVRSAALFAFVVISANSLALGATTAGVSEDSDAAGTAAANSTMVPKQILKSGINISAAGLSPNSRQMADILKLTAVLEQIQSLRAKVAATPRAATLESIEPRLELTEAVQEASGMLDEANLQVDFVLAEIQAEQNIGSEVLSTLQSKRDAIVNRSNQMSFITNGALWSVCEALDIPTWKRPKYSIASGITGILAGMVPSLASMYAMHASSGKKITSELEPNMLAEIFDYPVNNEVQYPKAVWSFLDSVPPSDRHNKTRRRQLIDRWISDSNIPQFTTSVHSELLDVLTGSASHNKGLSIDRLSTRQVMLEQLSAEVMKVKRLLLELTMVVRGEKHTALAELGAPGIN